MKIVASKNGDLCHLRAVEMIKKNFGSIRDLPKQVWPVIWVTVYRSCEIAMKVEAGGGSNTIVKSILLDGGRDAYEFERGIRKIEFLRNFIPLIRQAKSEIEQLGASSLLIDILKWDIADAGEMSILRRIIARLFAKADPLYAYPVPDEVL